MCYSTNVKFGILGWILLEPKKAKIKSEDSEQITLITRIRFTYPWLANNVMAIPNGGRRNFKLAALLKRAGVLRGAPDILVALVTPDAPGLFIEMKRTEGGTAGKDQRIIHQALRDEGYQVEVAEGADEAWDIFEKYVAPITQQREQTWLVNLANP